MRIREYLNARDDVLESEIIFEMIRHQVPKELARRIAATAFQNARELLSRVEPESIKVAVERNDIERNDFEPPRFMRAGEVG